VPNFSFEQYDTCPNSADKIQYAVGWSKYSIWASTPDYYNACSSSFGVPDNVISYQPAHRNCNAYAGIVTWGSAGNDREYIGIQLDETLTVGQKYFISFYAVMGGEKKIGAYYFEMPSNNIGIRLSTIAYNGNYPCPIDNFAHLNYPSILNDSINWTRISGSIIADSAYDYLIVGNFFDDPHTDTLHYNCDSCINNYSYYLIDDICISTDSSFCNGGIDILPCNAGVNEIAFDNDINIFPNPCIDFLNISSIENLNAEIIIYNLLGKIIYRNEISNKNNLAINLSNFPSGYYSLIINNKKDKTLITKKIIKL